MASDTVVAPNEKEVNDITSKTARLSLFNKLANKQATGTTSGGVSTDINTDFLLPRKRKKKEKNKGTEKERLKKNMEKYGDELNGLNCIHCNVKFYNSKDFQAHCRTEKHQHTTMSDEGRLYIKLCSRITP